MTTLRRAFDTPAAKRRYVRRLFATIADRYDLVTVLLSYGRDRAWKRLLVGLALPDPVSEAASAGVPAVAALDLACGTGDIALGLSARGAAVVGLDITPRMVGIARSKPAGGTCRWVVGDMAALPFPDASFDLVTTGYGLRNAADLTVALAEIGRVLRTGGRVLSLDFNRPANPFVRAAYLGYLTIVGSIVGLVLHGDPDTYRYIPASLRRYPGASGVAVRMRQAGLGHAGFVTRLGGLMAISYATKV